MTFLSFAKVFNNLPRSTGTAAPGRVSSKSSSRSCARGTGHALATNSRSKRTRRGRRMKTASLVPSCSPALRPAPPSQVEAFPGMCAVVETHLDLERESNVDLEQVDELGNGSEAVVPAEDVPRDGRRRRRWRRGVFWFHRWRSRRGRTRRMNGRGFERSRAEVSHARWCVSSVPAPPPRSVLASSHRCGGVCVVVN